MVFIIIAGLTLQTLIGDQADTVKPAVRQQYVKTQYAGNIGFVSIGTGYESRSTRTSIDINYGYLPKHINGARVHTFSLKPAFHFRKFKISESRTNFYMGAGINYSFGRNIYGKIPDYYSMDYYWPNAFHLNPYMGVRMGFNLKGHKSKRIYLYSELGTVEYKIWYAFKNKKIKPYEIWNLCFGLQFNKR